MTTLAKLAILAAVLVAIGVVGVMVAFARSFANMPEEDR